MLDEPELVRLIGGWVQKAENDLTMATAALALGRQCPTDMACFHAQQCVEKYLKAMLLWRGQSFPRTHDLTVLVARCAAADRPKLSPLEQEAMTRYATVTRYPGDYAPITLTEARRAAAVARRVRRFIRARLPQQALQPEE
jgi:HEPN domain-containing protein